VEGRSGSDTLCLLALETTCDETAAAIVEGPREGGYAPAVRSSVIASQFELHERFGGVVPEIAARAHLERLLPVIQEALDRSEVRLDQLDAIAVATRPGLVGSLVVGVTAAKALALVLGVPIVDVDHLDAHLFACQLAEPDRSVFPAVGLVVSGGHTSLFDCPAALEARLLGGTRDDAAGEAFDKVASLLGLGFPGGPAIERAARQGNPHAYAFPRAFKSDLRLEFSFSGLKTAVLYTLRSLSDQTVPQLDIEVVADLAASFQEAVVDVLVCKARRALELSGYRRLLVGGGVAANRRLREELARVGQCDGVEVVIPSQTLCTDNAAMVGAVGWAKAQRRLFGTFDLDVSAGLVRPASATTPGPCEP
jgi:N6-L-threonylcarbamoyladenine synthase